MTDNTEAGTGLVPTIIQRACSAVVRDAALQAGYTPMQATILGGRLAEHQASDIQGHLKPQMGDLDHPDTLPDIDRAADRIARAVVRKEPCILVSDHDVDGVSGHSVMRAAFLDIFQHPPALTHSFISHRLKEGYGVSEGVVARIKAAGHRGGLLLSADCGSSDEARIAKLKALGIETIVTDHHGVEGTGPQSAFATVNPVREDSRFPDPLIAGVYVAFLTMAAARQRLIMGGYLAADTPSLASYMDYAAMGTVVDCVSLSASRNNRVVVQRGLSLMNRFPRPCWTAMREQFGIDEDFTASTLSFKTGPALNARGRVDEAMTGVRFLRAPTLALARELAAQLHADNQTRKGKEAEMKTWALSEGIRQAQSGCHGIAVWLGENGHAGVHGIVASRLTEALGRPTVCLSPREGVQGVASASARTIPGFHVRDALMKIDQLYPGLLIAWGGHEGAGGLSLRVEDIPAFQVLWDQCARDASLVVGPRMETDGPIPRAPDFPMLAEISALEPYGRGFQAPVFSQRVVVQEIRPVGEGGKHLRMVLLIHGAAVPAIWFNVEASVAQGLACGTSAMAAFELGVNTFRGNTTIQALVRTLQPVLDDLEVNGS